MPRGRFITPLDARFHPDKNEWELLASLVFSRPCGDILIAPKGVFSDLASTRNVPFFPRDDVYNQAAVCHDFLYCGRFVSRWQADVIFNDMLWAIPEVPRWKIPVMFAAVRSPFGSRAWNKNSIDRIHHTRRLAGINIRGNKILWSDGSLRFC